MRDDEEFSEFLTLTPAATKTATAECSTAGRTAAKRSRSLEVLKTIGLKSAALAILELLAQTRNSSGLATEDAAPAPGRLIEFQLPLLYFCQLPPVFL